VIRRSGFLTRLLIKAGWETCPTRFGWVARDTGKFPGLVDGQKVDKKALAQEVEEKNP